MYMMYNRTVYCALHALCDQLSLVGLSTDVSHLRRIAVDFLKTQVEFFDDDFLIKRQYKNRDAYLKQQAVAGHWCDEIMLSALAAHYDVEINILHESGHTTKLCPTILNVQRIWHIILLCNTDRDSCSC